MTSRRSTRPTLTGVIRRPTVPMSPARRFAHGWLLLPLLAAAAALSPETAAAAPEVLSAGFADRPQAGKAARLEVVVRDPNGHVSEIHVGFGDGRPPISAYLAAPPPTAPPGTAQRVLLDYTYERAGRYSGEVAAFNHPSELEPLRRYEESTPFSFPVAVGPCFRPQASWRVYRTRGSRLVSLVGRLVERDAAALRVSVRWGDGRRAAASPVLVDGAGRVRLRHRYRRRGRFAMRVTLTSTGNPSECTARGEETVRWRRRLAAR